MEMTMIGILKRNKWRLLRLRNEVEVLVLKAWLRIPFVKSRWIKTAAEFFEAITEDHETDWNYHALQSYYAQFDSYWPKLDPVEAAQIDMSYWD